MAALAVLNPAAISHNLAVARRLSRSKIMAVVKANAYGHGLQLAASALQDADAFAVARVSEAVQLRDLGFAKSIIVLGGFTDTADLQALTTHNLATVLHSNWQLQMLENNPPASKIHLWLKLNIGMNRLGFSLREFPDIYRKLRQNFASNPLGVMTHLPCADDLANPATAQQISTFRAITAKMDGVTSIANSAAIMGWDSKCDWVRPGIMLYGASPFAHDAMLEGKPALQPAMSLYSTIIATRQLAAGDSVGYGSTWRSAKNTKIGIVAIGYGDGYPRSARSGTPILVNGNIVPLAGTVSMDMLAVDLGDTAATIGDRVTLWGEGLPLAQIAKWANTIPYTLTCGITTRCRRQQANLS